MNSSVLIFTGVCCFNHFDHDYRTTSIPPTHGGANCGKPWVLFSITCTRTWRRWWCRPRRFQRFSFKWACWERLASACDKSTLPFPPHFHSFSDIVLADVDSCVEYCWLYLYWTGKVSLLPGGTWMKIAVASLHQCLVKLLVWFCFLQILYMRKPPRSILQGKGLKIEVARSMFLMA